MISSIGRISPTGSRAGQSICFLNLADTVNKSQVRLERGSSRRKVVVLPNTHMEFKWHVSMTDFYSAAHFKRFSEDLTRIGVEQIVARLICGDTQEVRDDHCLSCPSHCAERFANEAPIPTSEFVVEDAYCNYEFRLKLDSLRIKFRTGERRSVGTVPRDPFCDEFRNQVNSEIPPFPAAYLEKSEQIAKAATDVENTCEFESLDRRGESDRLRPLRPAQCALVVTKLSISLAVSRDVVYFIVRLQIVSRF
jgi:hypothetical protein